MKNKIYLQLFVYLLILIGTLVPVTLLLSQTSDSLSEQDVPRQDSSLLSPVLQNVDTAANNNIREENQEKKEKVNPSTVFEEISFSKIFWSIVFFVAGYFIIRVLTQIIGKIAERSTQSRITFKGIVPAVRIIGWLVVIFIIVWGIIDPPLETVLAVTASVGIAVGFASQDILKNIFGGIVILLDKPFQVGDKIEVGSYYGEVVEIGLRSTRVVTPDDSLVSIPNGELMNTSVSNSNTGELNCQVVAEIYLPMDVDTEKIRQIAIEAACVSKYIYLNKPITVLFGHELKERKAYLKMKLKAYVMDIRYEFVFKSDLTEIVIRELFTQHIIKENDYS